MGKIIVLANQKGGVGKTTTAINLAASLSVLEKRVLVIDADPQANATSGLGFDTTSSSIYDILINGADIMSTIQQSRDVPNLYIVPSNINLVGAETELLSMDRAQYRMKIELEKVKHLFDYIIIDCSPSLGLITLNALTAADSVLIPVQCEYFALEGLGKLLNTIKMVKTGLNQQLEIEGFLFTMYDSRLKLANQVVTEVKTHFGELVFETIIRRNTRLSESPSFGKPVILYDAQSIGSTNYLNLAREFIERNEKTQ